MKKMASFFVILIMFSFVWGCSRPSEIPGKENEKGAIPTHDFSVEPYLQDNAIFPQNSEFTISGLSENGVLLKVDIYDQNDALIKTASDIAANDGEFSVKITAPKGSFNKYRIVINDSVHEHSYENILFGEVWIFAGEQLNESFDYQDKEFNQNVRIFNYDNNEYSWSCYESDSSIYPISYEFGNKLQKSLNVPIAIIDSTIPVGNADAWISHFTASNQLKIYNYLKSVNRYIPNLDNIVLKTNNLSSMYNTYLSLLKGINVKGMIWQQGVTDFSKNNNDDIHKLLSNYSYLTSNIFLDYINYFNGQFDIYSIQNGFVNIDFANELRSAQEQASYLVNNVHIIPTYDCHIVEENETEDKIESDLEVSNVNYVFSVEKFISRITNDVMEHTYKEEKNIKYSMLTNVVINNNVIILTFSNEIELTNVDEIYGLRVYTSDNYDIKHQSHIEENTVIIYLNDLFFDENMDVIVSYAENDDLYKCNLYNIYKKPVLPFRVEIRD